MRQGKARRLYLSELVGSRRWSRPGLDGLDLRLVDAVGARRNGVFLEFGANDGLQQSNTYLLERELGWTGVLVEALAELAGECVRNRPGADVVCAAVVEPGASGTVTPFVLADLVSHSGESHYYAAGVTVSGIIDDVLGGEAPDLMVVDVEGYEAPALKGLDTLRHRPKWILVETKEPERVREILGAAYCSPLALSHHDYLFKRGREDG